MPVTNSTVQSEYLTGINGATNMTNVAVSSGEVLCVVLASSSYNLSGGTWSLDWGTTDLTGDVAYSNTNTGFDLMVFLTTGLSGTETLSYDPDNANYPFGIMLAFTIAGGDTITVDAEDDEVSWVDPIQLNSVSTPDGDAVAFTIFAIEDTNQVTLTLDPDTSGAVSMFVDTTVASNNMDILVWKEQDASSITPDLGATGSQARQYSAYTFVVPLASSGATIDAAGPFNGDQGHPETWTLTSTGWTDETWSVDSLPSGITLTDELDGTATITHDGTATASTYTPTFTLGDDNRQVSITIDPYPTAQGTTDTNGEIVFQVTHGPGIQAGDDTKVEVTIDGVTKSVTHTYT